MFIVKVSIKKTQNLQLIVVFRTTQRIFLQIVGFEATVNWREILPSPYKPRQRMLK